jgi:hypothetical protein
MSYQSERIPATLCCNKCNPSLAPQLINPPATLLDIPVKPRVGTRAAAALPFVDEWAEQRANTLFQNRRWRMTPSTFMPDPVRWQVCHLYAGNPKKDVAIVWESLDAAILMDRAPLLKQWRHWQDASEDLVVLLRAIVSKVEEEMRRLNELERAEKERKAQESSFRIEQEIIRTPPPALEAAIHQDDQ